ncbi:hypothetical protein NQ314_018538 [Rhamnusium bicolor]|uniref:Mutator-like transposase domain-containing protein n=1 Tax=Rhamnusium bicolor TaxID=1586634 RepID=A0AAV8WSV4_9CUCU|nr:hypothetical protein NQ314_018538 [Rhamnusium bicolor]
MGNKRKLGASITLTRKSCKKRWRKGSSVLPEHSRLEEDLTYQSETLAEFSSEKKNDLEISDIQNEDIMGNNSSDESDEYLIEPDIPESVISIGCGFSQLEEFFSCLNIPPMTPTVYELEHINIGTIIYDTAWEEIEKAGKEEADIAKEKEDVDEDGIPCITVISYGAWSKRSYKTNYDALSGVACIIGEATKKVIFLGVRNKYCCICARAEKKGEPSMEHKCFKNWAGSSTSMETDIILEGFRTSVQLHGLKYTKLVGDGDSSITKKLQELKPYGTKLVQKIECVNHLLRNFCQKLKETAKSSRNSANKLIPMKLRKKLENSILKFRIAIKKAAEYRFREELWTTYSENTKKSDAYFCSGPKEGEENLLVKVTECGLKHEILKSLQRITNNGSSLLLNKNNNPAERFNSVLCKFVGGKRINFSLKGSYEVRCQCATISYNCKEKYWETILNALGYEPGEFLIKLIKKRRRWYAPKNKINSSRKIKPRKEKCEPDEDYGNVNDVTEEELLTRKETLLKSLAKTDEEIMEIERNTQGQSANPAWKQEHAFRLTASNFGSVCKRRSNTPPNKLVKQLLYGRFFGNAATRYGSEHEAIAIEDFQELTGFQVETCGIFIGNKMNISWELALMGSSKKKMRL